MSIQKRILCQTNQTKKLDEICVSAADVNMTFLLGGPIHGVSTFLQSGQFIGLE